MFARAGRLFRVAAAIVSASAPIATIIVTTITAVTVATVASAVTIVAAHSCQHFFSASKIIQTLQHTLKHKSLPHKSIVYDILGDAYHRSDE